MVDRSGLLRERLRLTLTEAYGSGLLSHTTFVARLDLLVSQPLIEPERLVGDLTLRRAAGDPLSRWWQRLRGRARRLSGHWARSAAGRPRGLPIVGLDWSGTATTLLLGRADECDIAFADETVSRRHAALTCRDGRWVVQDLQSRNGTWVNGRRVSRCEVRAGDLVAAGDQRFWID
jgi:hypothetical protein